MPFNNLNPISIMTFSALCAERKKQFEKFGAEPLANRCQLVTIITEEVGEIAREVNQAGKEEKLRQEVLQVAAICIAYLDGDLHFGNQK